MVKIAGFSEATYIALHCMVLIAQNEGEKISIKEMAEILSVSEAHLAKVVMRLSRSGLINTTRGPRGGAVLARQHKEITFLDVVNAIDGPLESKDCVFGKKSCAYENCIFGGFLAKITKEASEWLISKNLAEFIKMEKGK